MRLTESQRAAAVLLARGGSQREAAEAAGVSQMTISRWSRDPVFAQLVADLEEQQTEIEAAKPDDPGDDWRDVAGVELRAGALAAAQLMRRAAQGEAVPRASVDAARWLLDRAEVQVAPEEGPPVDVDAYLDSLSELVLLEALARRDVDVSALLPH